MRTLGNDIAVVVLLIIGVVLLFIHPIKTIRLLFGGRGWYD